MHWLMSIPTASDLHFLDVQVKVPAAGIESAGLQNQGELGMRRTLLTPDKRRNKRGNREKENGRGPTASFVRAPPTSIDARSTKQQHHVLRNCIRPLCASFHHLVSGAGIQPCFTSPATATDAKPRKQGKALPPNGQPACHPSAANGSGCRESRSKASVQKCGCGKNTDSLTKSALSTALRRYIYV